LGALKAQEEKDPEEMARIAIWRAKASKKKIHSD
jgi:hypothetical protein